MTNSFNDNLEFNLAIEEPAIASLDLSLEDQLAAFQEFDKPTTITQTHVRTFTGQTVKVPTYVNEFWTSKQRAANSLHEIPYRACFKPQLPRFFIQRLSGPGEVVYDPFMGRGTTLVEAALLGRVPSGCDSNPVSPLLTCPRLDPPTLGQIEERLEQIDLKSVSETRDDLMVFYDPETLRELCALRAYLLDRRKEAKNDNVDDWILMVALSRLTGHSAGFFSVYTLPPNQAVSIDAQRKINLKRNQTPPRRYVKDIILKKSRELLQDCCNTVRTTVRDVGARGRVLTARSSNTPDVPDAEIALVVTSPPFLDVVDYIGDNWLRCWFAGIDPAAVNLTTPRKLNAWQESMTAVFHELWRVVRPGGHVAFEVGEIRGGKIKLEEAVVPCGIEAQFSPVLILINDQEFTKTANCWGVENNAKGTNTNRIVVFRK